MLSHPPSLDDRCYRLAMQSAAAGMAIIDLQGRWVDVNPALARLLGHDDPQALLGQSIVDSFHPEDAAPARHRLDALIGAAPSQASPDDAGQALPLVQRYRDRDGTVFQAAVDLSVMRDHEGAPCYLLMQLHDARRQGHGEGAAARSLDEAERALQALARQQEVLAHGISHDLRAPLRAIDSFSTLLQSHCGEALDDTGRSHLQRIRAAAKRMGSLLDALLDLSRVDRTTLAPEAVDISLLADWIAADLRDAHPHRPAEITVAPGLQAYGNERLLRMLLQQLLDNAWRFSAARDSVRIQVDGHESAGRLQVTVSDQGSGFDMRYADRIMDPFQRLHSPEQGGGHGLGLAIANRIVERHGGWLRGRSTGDAGSVFTFELPAVDLDAGVDADPDGQRQVA